MQTFSECEVKRKRTREKFLFLLKERLQNRQTRCVSVRVCVCVKPKESSLKTLVALLGPSDYAMKIT